MLLLLTHALPTLLEHRHPNLGRLLQPRHFHQARETHEAGFSWAVDNDAYNDFDESAFEKMIDQLAGAPGCKFVACPDNFGEAGLTNLLYEEWAPQIMARGLPVAYVLQDAGVEYEMWTDENADRWLPWGAMDALFIGGSDENHFEIPTERIVREAKRRGKWVHMGRVNGVGRIRTAAEMGCDSVDGTNWPRFRDTPTASGLGRLDWALDYIKRMEADGVAGRLEL